MSDTKINPFMFREYDIRGEVGKDLTLDAATLIGKAYATVVLREGGKKVCCGRDGRVHSPDLSKALIQGMLSTGLDVIDVGMCPTPVLYFAIQHIGTDGGVQITGSHNPPEFNGFKMCLGTATMFGEQIKDLQGLIEAGDFEKGTGMLEELDVITPYLAYIKDHIDIKRPLKVVVDAGNGVAGLVAPKAFEDQGCEVVPLFCDVDGMFPNHHPDPTIPENMKTLREKVLETGADLGVGYDGDGDRLGVIDEKGNQLYGDQVLMIFAREILKDVPGAAIIGEVKCSQTLYDDIAAHGGRPIMWKTGHSLIKKKMREEGAPLAGEMSGHIFIAHRYLGFDDGVYASVRLAEILSSDNRPLSEFLADVDKTFSTPEIRVDCPDDIKFDVVEQVKAWFKDRYSIIDVDGVRIQFKDGWGLVRASNTQPVLVLRFEAKDKDRLEEIRTLVEQKVQEIREKVQQS